MTTAIAACPRCKRPARGSRLAVRDGECATVPVPLELGADGHCASCRAALEVLAMLERHGITGADYARAEEHLAPNGKGGCVGYGDHASYPIAIDLARLNTWPAPVRPREPSPDLVARLAAWPHGVCARGAHLRAACTCPAPGGAS